MTVYVNWHENVACRDADPDLFFPIGTTGAALRQVEEAKRICRVCPVQVQCLDWALENGVTDGLWGGATPEERRVIRSLSRKPTTSKADGDDKSYHPAERREHGICAQAAPGKTARILRRVGIGPDAGGTRTTVTLHGVPVTGAER